MVPELTLDSGNPMVAGCDGNSAPEAAGCGCFGTCGTQALQSSIRQFSVFDIPVAPACPGCSFKGFMRSHKTDFSRRHGAAAWEHHIR